MEDYFDERSRLINVSGDKLYGEVRGKEKIAVDDGPGEAGGGDSIFFSFRGRSHRGKTV